MMQNQNWQENHIYITANPCNTLYEILRPYGGEDIDVNFLDSLVNTDITK